MNIIGSSRRLIYFNSGTIPFWSMHVAAVVGVIWCGFSSSGVLLAAAMYYIRMLFLSAGFHRYFSHRAYKTSRAFQFILAVLGQTCTVKDALWWAANHRQHHRHSDGPENLHSPRVIYFDVGTHTSSPSELDELSGSNPTASAIRHSQKFLSDSSL